MAFHEVERRAVAEHSPGADARQLAALLDHLTARIKQGAADQPRYDAERQRNDARIRNAERATADRLHRIDRYFADIERLLRG